MNGHRTSQQVAIEGKKLIIVDAKNYFGFVQKGRFDGGEGIGFVDDRLPISFVKIGIYIDP
jgi:hypothetical protein